MHLMGGVPPNSQNEEFMNTTTVSSSSIAVPTAVPAKADTSRCPYRYPNGKRCRLPGLQAHSGFCLGHSKVSTPGAFPLHSQSDSEDLSPDLLPQLSEFDSAVDIYQFLNRLLVLVAKGRISPRRAAVLAYITNQLLHSHRAIEREHNAQAEEPQQIIFDLPRPQRD
jgi:hypothetical protein